MVSLLRRLLLLLLLLLLRSRDRRRRSRRRSLCRSSSSSPPPSSVQGRLERPAKLVVDGVVVPARLPEPALLARGGCGGGVVVPVWFVC